ncbi:M16 family metallopeptidase [Streptosporangium carneum]|uniref:Peptidase M16 n=1 Tax=Streptosporangium carneum TaxID=47481 RepID=A0A9W6I0G7_9ACTN|nr:pitrilysin family protein [Streptosporangium carneum]GLK08999.1 peptidase M16 [Streptosporangium carneum]
MTRVPSPEVVVPRTGYRIERFTLGNGLRVVLAPEPGSPVVGVAVVYGVGIRSEPEGRTGFAHLFEHLMFQGSANLEKFEHFRHVQGAGGTFNGSTHLDYTEYFQTVPANALERVLFLEADRMREPRLTPENLLNQIDVVKEEIRVNILNRPYGGFPWLRLPPVMFDTFPNAHDGYGSFADLEAAVIGDAEEFFDRHYACGNAVLSVTGGFAPEEARRMVERHFGDVPARPAPPRPDLSEPDLAETRRHSYVDEAAPTPAVAAAWRVPDPVADLAGYLPYVVLAEVLTDGVSSRLVERLVLKERLATGISGHTGFMGDAFDVLDPTALVLQLNLPSGGSAERALEVVDEEVERLAADGLTQEELARVQARMVALLLRDGDAVIGRGVRMAVLELQRGAPGLLNELPALLTSVTPGEIRAAASRLRPGRRASLEVVPGRDR